MALHWSTHQLTEYFSAVSAPPDRSAAIQVAGERAAEALDAEIGGVVLQGEVSGCVGLGSGRSSEQLLDAAEGADTVSLPELGLMHAAAAPLDRDRRSFLVVCRFAEPFAGEERHMLLGMAQVLGLALHSLDVLAGERALREAREREAEERLRLLDALTARQHLLENLLQVQRAIAGRQPLQVVLDAVTGGAAGLLGDSTVALMLTDPFVPDALICASTSSPTGPELDLTRLLAAATRAMSGPETPAPAPETTAPETTTEPGHPDGPVLLAAPVVVDGRPVGCLVATSRPQDETGQDETGHDETGRAGDEKEQTLAAFAQQVSLALSDARALERIEEAYHDTLTGLPSRTLFIQRLEQELAAGALVNVLFIDLDRFKAVNDSLGHAAGDELLSAVAGRLKGCLRGEDHAARLGGDEFAVLVPGVPETAVVAIGQRIIDALARPFRISGRDVLIGASVGVARGRAPQIDAAELLGDADVAMYRAKKSGAGRVTVFEPAMQAQALETLSLSSDLQHALAERQIDLRFQPMVNLRTGRPVALEALVRWHHPARGDISPATFIPLAEQTGLIIELGRWVLRQALARAATWRRNHPDVAVSVNVSARQIVDPGFVTDVEHLLAVEAVPPDKLLLELTETALVTNLDAALSCVRDLKDLGTQLAVDDFGTSYSSLSHLRRFPVDLLKIDGSFVRSMFIDPREEALVRAVLGLGRSLQIATVAEGIETPAQLAMLRSNDCELGQGYLLGRPMSGTEVAGYLSREVVGLAG